MTSRRNLYLHIGYHKTGTTAIQTCLAQNNKLFLEHGYHYPLVGLHGQGHHNIAWEIRQFRRFSRRDGTLRDLLREAENKATPNIIISSEEFCKADRSEIARLAEELRAYHVTVIVYLRRQDQLLQSIWAQLTKTGHQCDSFPEWLDKVLTKPDTETPNKYAERVVPRLNFAEVLADWGSAFGQDNIRVRPYERSQLHSDIVVDFMQTCDLQDTQWVPQADQSNVTPSIKTLEALRYMTAKLRDAGHTENDDRGRGYIIFLTQLRDTADKLGWNNEKLNLITPEIYARIMEPFVEGNREVARLYLGRDTLFVEDFQARPVTGFTIDELTAEEAMEFAGPALAEILRRAASVNKTYNIKFIMNLFRQAGLFSFIKRYPRFAKQLKVKYRHLI